MDKLMLSGLMGKYALIIEAADDGTFWITTSNVNKTGHSPTEAKEIMTASFDRWLEESPVENEGSLTEEEKEKLEKGESLQETAKSGQKKA